MTTIKWKSGDWALDRVRVESFYGLIRTCSRLNLIKRLALQNIVKYILRNGI